MLILRLLTDPIFFFRIVAILIISVCLHELAHGWAAISQGDDTPIRTGHMTLNPVVHMGWESIIYLCLVGIVWGSMPVNPARFRNPVLGNILVSAAGPLLNLGLAILCIIILAISAHHSDAGILSGQFFWLAARINLILFMFNLLPIPPLDGFHICSELIPALKPLQYSQFGLFAFVVIYTTGFSAGLSKLADVAIYAALPLR